MEPAEGGLTYVDLEITHKRLFSPPKLSLTPPIKRQGLEEVEWKLGKRASPVGT